jgi:hypothetical protein
MFKIESRFPEQLTLGQAVKRGGSFIFKDSEKEDALAIFENGNVVAIFNDGTFTTDISILRHRDFYPCSVEIKALLTN